MGKCDQSSAAARNVHLRPDMLSPSGAESDGVDESNHCAKPIGDRLLKEINGFQGNIAMDEHAL